MGVNGLPKTVTRHRRGCDLNAGPSAPESSTLTTPLTSNKILKHLTVCVAAAILVAMLNIAECPGQQYQPDTLQEVSKRGIAARLW